MIIAGIYSFNQGREVIEKQYRNELKEVMDVITVVQSSEHKTKESREKTMPGRLLYSPAGLNTTFKQHFAEREWVSHRVSCDYPTQFYTADYHPGATFAGAFREIDFVKNRVGVEVQFGKYAFMVYNVCAKMTIFHNLDFIDVGIEIVPIKDFADEMSTGVSYFEQFVWDLEQRGVSNIDIPVLVLGVMADKTPEIEPPVPPLLEQ
ncbi:MAG TPA: BglII/BstYI family type II restriction endonuclease [Phototrophicaceae bacterium]|nr:BglII/BstYI family type II restriction endonuclease [Phototrophicaceae bacterium]